MADAGIGEGILTASAVAGAGASVYSASQAGVSAPKAPTLPNTPQSPNVKAAAASLDQGDIAAKTAGGTLLSRPGAIGDNANGTRKTLLGT